MQFSSLLFAAAAFTLAQAVKFTNPNFNSITAGVPFNISWTEASGPVTILLKNGPADNLKTVSTIGSGLSGTSYTWSVPSTLVADTYALEITDSSGEPNYSVQFQLIGGVSSSSSASSTSSANSTSSSASSTVTGFSNSSSTATTTGRSTTSTATSTRTSSGASDSTSSSTSSSTAPPDSSNSATGLASNLALIFLGFVAIMTLN